MKCPDCLQPFEELEDVACDGCHIFFHRRCLNYELVNVDWDDQPKAYAFCRGCQDLPEFEI